MDPNGQRETAKMAAEKVFAKGQELHWQLSDHIRARDFLRDLNTETQFATETLLRELNGLKTSFHVVLQNARFAYLPTPDDKYFENEKLFGEEVFAAFAEARQDSKDAGNCLASGLYTACVFHLMRVSEFGLRRLAIRLKVKLVDKGKRQQLQYGDWNKVIEGVRSRIAKARKLPLGLKREEQLTRFSESADHCTFMKDIWRNSVSHTREPYNRHEALAALARVGEFMKFLAGDMSSV